MTVDVMETTGTVNQKCTEEGDPRQRESTINIRIGDGTGIAPWRRRSAHRNRRAVVWKDFVFLSLRLVFKSHLKMHFLETKERECSEKVKLVNTLEKTPKTKSNLVTEMALMTQPEWKSGVRTTYQDAEGKRETARMKIGEMPHTSPPNIISIL